MKLTAIAAALILAAWTPATQPKQAGLSKPEASAQQTGDAPTPAMLVGRWGDNGDCTKDIVFYADGTFLSYTGGSGSWSLNGDILTASGAAGTGQVRVSILNGNQLQITNPDGSIGVSQRC